MRAEPLETGWGPRGVPPPGGLLLLTFLGDKRASSGRRSPRRAKAARGRDLISVGERQPIAMATALESKNDGMWTFVQRCPPCRRVRRFDSHLSVSPAAVAPAVPPRSQRLQERVGSPHLLTHPLSLLCSSSRTSSDPLELLHLGLLP